MPVRECRNRRVHSVLCPQEQRLDAHLDQPLEQRAIQPPVLCALRYHSRWQLAMIPDQYNLARPANQRDQSRRFGGLRGFVDENAGEPAAVQ